MDIKAANEADLPALIKLHDAAFGTPHEGRLVGDLHHADLAAISLMAMEGAAILGHVVFSPLAIEVDNETVLGLALAPLAVTPARQRQGIGTALMEAGLVAAAQHGWQAVIVLGQPRFYERFGFSPALARGFQTPFAGPYLMALELSEGTLSGRKGKIIYAKPFAELGAEAPQTVA
ncbi:MAG: N-acetyltransferase [Proteobacteria bacterium]|nr:N-acetyltransferase [Pseudomonadota bacterium]